MEPLIEKLKQKPALQGYDFNNIYPVTIVEIDTLMVFADSFRNGQLELDELLRTFHFYVKYNAKPALVGELEAHNKIVGMSFSRFVLDCAKTRNIQPSNDFMDETLSEIGLTLELRI